MTKAIVYTRQSKHRDESITHEIQEAACRNYASQKGYEVVEVFTEKGVSGMSISKRKEFQTAVQMIKDGQAEVMLVWRWSRFARNTLDGLLTLKSIEEEAGGRVECALEQIDRSAMGKFSLTMMLGYAEVESQVKSEQWIEALDYRLQKGLPPTGLEFWGYKRLTEKVKSGLEINVGYEIDEELAEVIRTCMQRVIDGESLRNTAKWLNEQGLRTNRGALFAGSPLSILLKNPFLRGYIRWNGKEHKGAHEPIISEAMFKKFEDAIQTNKKFMRTEVPSHRLVGMLTCSQCGRKFSFQTVKPTVDKPNPRNYFRCSTRHTAGKDACSAKAVNVPELDNAVDWWLPRHWQDIEKAVPEESNSLEAIESKEIVIEKLKTKLTQTLMVGTDAGLSSDEMTDALRTIKDELEAEQKALDELQIQTQVQTRPWWEIEDVIHGDDVLASRAMLKKIIKDLVIDETTLVIHPWVGEPWTWYLGSGPRPTNGFEKPKRPRRTKAQMLEARTNLQGKSQDPK